MDSKDSSNAAKQVIFFITLIFNLVQQYVFQHFFFMGLPSFATAPFLI
jgi:hypothetical protein